MVCTAQRSLAGLRNAARVRERIWCVATRVCGSGLPSPAHVATNALCRLIAARLVAVTARLYDWCVAFCWSFGIGRDLSTPTSWAPVEQWPGERHLCFPSYREYKTRQRALWIANALQNTVGPDYMNTVGQFKLWLRNARLTLTTPRAQMGKMELQSEKECLACLAPATVSITAFRWSAACIRL